MDKVSGKLTVFFEEPFWVGVFERISEGKLAVCKVTFGAEPKDYEMYDFVTETAKFLPLISKMVFTAYHLKNGLLICGDLRRGIL